MRTLLLALLLPVSALASSPLRALWVEAEVGPAYVFQNDNRYGPTGTTYSAEDVGQKRTLLQTSRLTVEARLAERHGVLLSYIPFSATTRATLARDIDFRGTVFGEGTVVDSGYLFDGYRASYLYRLVQGEAFTWDVGATLQVRNALVTLGAVDGTRFAEESDIGLVGALKTRLVYRLPSRVWAALEADALSSFGLFNTTGGIYDVALTLGVPLDSNDAVSGYLRLRLLGGGADVPGRDIATWAHFGFAVAGVQADLVELVARTLVHAR